MMGARVDGTYRIAPIKCSRCGQPQARDQFLPWLRSGAYCRTCRNARQRERRHADPALAAAQARRYSERYPDRINGATVARRARENQATRPAATKHGNEWTSAELELVNDYRYTAFELALKLGRTARAVQAARHKINAGDPRTVALLGAARGTITP